MIGMRVRKPACPGLGAGVVVKKARPNARVWWKVKWDAMPGRAATTEHQNNLEEIPMQRWVFYANSDWTESEVNELKTAEPPAKHDVDGKQYSFVHVFEAVDWDTAMLQIKRLRYGQDGGTGAVADAVRARNLLRQLPSQAPEGSVNWQKAMEATLNAFVEVRRS